MKKKNFDQPSCYSLALVAYIPDPLRSFLESLRRALPGEEDPQAHITILPPRALRIPVEKASPEVKAILSKFRPFSVKLSTVNVFAETNTLYLNIGSGNKALHKLHNALNAGDLANEEAYEFLPHLTISGSIPRSQLATVRSAAERAWSKRTMPTGFQINEVVALCQPLAGTWTDWSRVWSHQLGTASNAASAST